MDKQYALQETKKHVIRFRNPEKIQEEDLISAFLDHVEDEEIDTYATDEEEKAHKEIVNKFRAYMRNYLDYDLAKVEQGEILMLEQWSKSVLG
jgi:hypothetical protein